MIVPVLNAATTLPNQLDALAVQRCGVPWELVAADNGSTDPSRRIVEEWLAEGAREGSLVDASGAAGAGPARNAAAAHATGDLLVFTDADDVVAPGWLQAIADAATRGDLVAGRLEVDEVNDPVVRSWFHGPPADRPITAHGFLPFAGSGNCAVWRDVFDEAGGFDPAMRYGGDIDFSWRVQLAGRDLVFAAEAVLRRRYPDSVRAVARQHYRWGQANALLYRRHRAAGMPRPSARQVVRTWASIVASAPLAPFSRTRRGRWVRLAALRLGHAVGSLRHRVVFP